MAQIVDVTVEFFHWSTKNGRQILLVGNKLCNCIQQREVLIGRDWVAQMGDANGRRKWVTQIGGVNG